MEARINAVPSSGLRIIGTLLLSFRNGNKGMTLKNTKSYLLQTIDRVNNDKHIYELDENCLTLEIV